MIKNNTLLFLTSEFLSKATTFLSILVVAKFFTKEIFGLLILYFVAFELLTIIVTNGINACARIDYFKREEYFFVKTYQAHLLNSFFTSLLSIIIALIFFSDYFIEIILLSLAAFLRTIFMLSLAIVQCKELAKEYFKINMLYTTLYNSLFILFLFLGYTVLAWVYAIFIAYLITSIALFRFYLNDFIKSFKTLSITSLKEQFFEGVIFLPQAVGFWSRTGSERFYLSIFLSLSTLGIYSFNFQLSLPIVIFGTAINIYLTPIIAKKIKAQNEKEILGITKKYALLIILTSLLFMAGAYLISKFFFFEKYFDSFYLTIWTTVINLSYVLMLLFINPLYYLGRKKIVSNFIFFYGVFLSTTNFFVIKYFNIHGLIVFNLITNFIFLIFSYQLLLKYIHANKF